MVVYTIGQSKFMRTFSIIFFCGVVVALNSFLFVFRDKIEYSGFFALNGFLGFGLLLAFGLNWMTKRIVNQKFKDEFEIGVEDEWAKKTTDTSPHQ
jgi:hypothetical protein